MKALILMFVISFGLSKTIKAIPLVPDSIKTNSIKLAKEDINSGLVLILLRSGIVSKYEKGQALFEKKYKLKYKDYGCVAPGNLSIEYYNKTVAIYLDKKFGRTWRTEVRKDAMGI